MNIIKFSHSSSLLYFFISDSVDLEIQCNHYYLTLCQTKRCESNKSVYHPGFASTKYGSGKPKTPQLALA